MVESLIRSLAVSLALTLIIEAGFFLLVGKRNKKDLLLLVLVNVITNPLVVLISTLMRWFTSVDPWVVTIVLESGAVLTEGLFYRHYGKSFKRPLLFSLAANACSYGIGLLLQLILGPSLGGLLS